MSLSLPRVGCLVAVLAFGLVVSNAHAQDDNVEAPWQPQATMVERLPPLAAPMAEPAELPEAESVEPVQNRDESTVVESVDELPAEMIDEGMSLTRWAPFQHWEGSVEFGLNGTTGNSETFNMRLGSKLKRETDFSTQTYKISYLTKSDDGSKSARNSLFDGRVEWPLSDTPWSTFVHGAGEYDEFKPFDVRLFADAGIGYDFIKNDATTLVGRVGGSVSHEIGGPDDAYVPEMLFGTELSRQLSQRQKLSAEVEYYPDVTAFHEFRLNSQASWEIVIDPEWGLSLKLSVVDRYDSTPNGARHNDLDYSALMLWSF